MPKALNISSVILIGTLILGIPAICVIDSIKKEEAFRANINTASFEIKPKTTDSDIVKITNKGTLCIKKIVLSSRNAKIILPGFEVDLDKTDVKKLGDQKQGQTIEIILPKQGKGGLPDIEILTDDKTTFVQALDIYLKENQRLKYSIEKRGDTVKLLIEPLKAISQLKFNIQSVKFKAKDCLLNYGSLTGFPISKTPYEQVTITGKTKNRKRTATLIIGDASTFELYLKTDASNPKAKNFMYELNFNKDALKQLHQPVFKGVMKGGINIFGNKFIDMEKQFLTGSEVSIDTTLEGIDEFLIGSEGITVGIDSKSNKIEINGTNQVQSHLDGLLKSKALVIIIALIILVVDNWLLIWLQKKPETNNRIQKIEQRLGKIEEHIKPT